MNPPTLSLVVALQNARPTVEACLASLLGQRGLGAGEFEILLLDGSHDGTAEWVARSHPEIVLVRAEAGASLPRLMGLGLARAKGKLVAFTEGHCTLDPDWAVAAVAAHRQYETAAIGGIVEPDESFGPWDWALYFADYGQFLKPVVSGTNTDLPGNNVVFKRAALPGARQCTETGFWKTFHCRQLASEGRELRAEPALVAHYHRRITPGALVGRRFRHGRCYGGMRATGLSWTRRALYALSGPLLPGLLLTKLVLRVWPKNRYRTTFLGTLPHSLVAIGCWATGEWIGNLFGPGCSCDSL